MTVQSVKRSALPDLVIACVVLLICGGALAVSFTYPPETQLFLPRVAAGLGMAGAAWTIISTSIELSRRREQPVLEEDVDTAGPSGEGELDSTDAQVVLSHTPRNIWMVTLGVITGFFLLLYLCGIFIAAGALSFFYLFVVGKKTLRFTLIYTAIFTASLWFLMRIVIYIVTPAGVLIDGG